MEAFNPAQAIQTLRENYLAIEALGLEIEQKANEHTIAEAELQDEEQVARAKQ